jgi:hypothetical protein
MAGNLYSFLDENSAFQTFLQNQSLAINQEKEAGAEQEETGVVGGLETIPLVKDLYERGTQIYEKVSDVLEKGKNIVNKGQELIQKTQEGAQKIGTAVEEGAEKLQGVAGNLTENLSNTVGDLAQQAKGALAKTVQTTGDIFRDASSRAVASTSRTGAELSRGLQERAFNNEDFEEGPAGLFMKTEPDLINTARNTLRGGFQSIPKGVEGIGSDAMAEATSAGSKALQAGATAVEELGQTATKAVGSAISEASSAGADVIGAVASEAVPVVGELAGLGFGLYSLIHGFADKPHVDVASSMARPVFNAGI